jgi:hypothetical protein
MNWEKDNGRYIWNIRHSMSSLTATDYTHFSRLVTYCKMAAGLIWASQDRPMRQQQQTSAPRDWFALVLSSFNYSVTICSCRKTAFSERPISGAFSAASHIQISICLIRYKACIEEKINKNCYTVSLFVLRVGWVSAVDLRLLIGPLSFPFIGDKWGQWWNDTDRGITKYLEEPVAVTLYPQRVFWDRATASFLRNQQKITWIMA